MYINELRRFFGFRPRIAYCHFARSCARLPVRLRGRRISLHDSTKIAISGEKSKCRKNFEMQADFSIFVRMDRGEIIIYRTADGETRLEVRMESDSVG